MIILELHLLGVVIYFRRKFVNLDSLACYRHFLRNTGYLAWGRIGYACNVILIIVSNRKARSLLLKRLWHLFTAAVPWRYQFFVDSLKPDSVVFWFTSKYRTVVTWESGHVLGLCDNLPLSLSHRLYRFRKETIICTLNFVLLYNSRRKFG